MLAASFGLGHYPTFCAAFLDISLSAATILLTTEAWVGYVVSPRGRALQKRGRLK